jgi:hypothetical protein
VCVFGITII